MGLIRLLMLPLWASIWAGLLPFVALYALVVAYMRDLHSGVMTVLRFTRWCFTGKTWY